MHFGLFFNQFTQNNDLKNFVSRLKESHCKEEEDIVLDDILYDLKIDITAKDVKDIKWKEYLIKTLYLNMLGYDVSFMNLYAIKLIDKKDMPLKTLAYLTCSLIMDRNSELTFLMIATIQKDLKSNLSIRVLFALNTLSRIANNQIIPHIINDVLELSKSKLENIRKKSINVIHVFYRVEPSISKNDEIYQMIRTRINDKDASVISATINLLYDLVKENKIKYQNIFSDLIKLLKLFITNVFPVEFRYGGLNLPWAQIKLLRILSIFCHSNKENCEELYKLLETILIKNSRCSTNMIYALICECVKVICEIIPNDFLLETAAKSIDSIFEKGKQNGSSDYMFMGLKTLKYLAKINQKYISSYQIMIVDCMESQDNSIKREALMLLYSIVNSNNVNIVTEKLIEQLSNPTDKFFHKELVQKIFDICEKLSPNFDFYVSSMNQMMNLANEFIEETMFKRILATIDENIRDKNSEICERLIITYKLLIQRKSKSDKICKISAWIFGEVSKNLYKNSPEKIQELIEILYQIISYKFDDEITVSWILIALYKMSSAFEYSKKLNSLLTKFSRSKFSQIEELSTEILCLKQMPKAIEEDDDQPTVTLLSSNFNFLDVIANDMINSGYVMQSNHYSIKRSLSKSSINYFVNTMSKQITTKHSDSELLIRNTNWTKNGYTDQKDKSKNNLKEDRLNYQINESSEIIRVYVNQVISKEIMEHYINNQDHHLESPDDNEEESVKLIDKNECEKLMKTMDYYAIFLLISENSFIKENISNIFEKKIFIEASTNHKEILIAFIHKNDSSIIFCEIKSNECKFHIKANKNDLIRKLFSYILDKVLKSAII